MVCPNCNPRHAQTLERLLFSPQLILSSNLIFHFHSGYWFGSEDNRRPNSFPWSIYQAFRETQVYLRILGKTNQPNEKTPNQPFPKKHTEKVFDQHVKYVLLFGALCWYKSRISRPKWYSSIPALQSSASGIYLCLSSFSSTAWIICYIIWKGLSNSCVGWVLHHTFYGPISLYRAFLF